MSLVSCMLGILSLFNVRISEGINVTVTTSKGVVVGLKVDPNPNTGASYDSFLGIPYGQVPARFQPPEPRAPWSEPLVAHADGPKCPQPNVPFSEDCLYLNIFTPVNASQSFLPVMVYIHGGGFSTGSSSSLVYGPDFLVPAGVVLVTMNYRLGAAGFLTLGIPEAPGNLGLYDTTLALQWVQQEIVAFGGDPSLVTLFGHSAGSILTLYHYLSPVSSGLFKYVIGQSGPASLDSFFIPTDEAIVRAKKLSDAVGCRSAGVTYTELLACLQNADIQTIVAEQGNISISIEDIIAGRFLRFVPVEDTFAKHPFFPDNLETMVAQAVNRSKPLLTGFATEDGVVLFQSPDEGWKLVDKNLAAFIPSHLRSSLSENTKDTIVKGIREKYFPNTVYSNKILDITNLYTDSFFAYPTVKTAYTFANFTYGYVYKYQGVWNPKMPSYFSQFKTIGTFHGAELTYLFYKVNSSQDLGDCAINQPGLRMRDKLVSLWTTFAKTGSPDPFGTWGTVSNGHYLLIDEASSLINNSEVESQHYQLWADLEPQNNSAVNVTETLVIIIIVLFYSCSSDKLLPEFN